MNSFGAQVCTRTTRIFLVLSTEVGNNCAMLLDANLLLCDGEVLCLFVSEERLLGPVVLQLTDGFHRP